MALYFPDFTFAQVFPWIPEDGVPENQVGPGTNNPVAVNTPTLWGFYWTTMRLRFTGGIVTASNTYGAKGTSQIRAIVFDDIGNQYHSPLPLMLPHGVGASVNATDLDPPQQAAAGFYTFSPASKVRGGLHYPQQNASMVSTGISGPPAVSSIGGGPPVGTCTVQGVWGNMTFNLYNDGAVPIISADILIETDYWAP